MKLIDAIKAKFAKPEDALAALGLDASTIAMDSFAQVEKAAAKEYGSEEAGKRVAAAVGFKKYGKAGMERKAQEGKANDAETKHDPKNGQFTSGSGGGGGAGGGGSKSSPQEHPFGSGHSETTSGGGVAKAHSDETHKALNDYGFQHNHGPSRTFDKVEYHLPEGHHAGRRSVSIVPHGGSHEGFMWNSYKGGSRAAGGEGNASLLKHLSRLPKKKAGDSNPPHLAGDSKEKVSMTTKTKWSPTALVAMGALHQYLAPRLAQDSAVDLGTILKGVTAKNIAARRPFITTEIRRAVVGNLAQDADVEDLPAMLDQIEALAGEASETVTGGGEGNPMADPDDDYEDDKDADAGDPDDKPMEGSGEDDASEIREFLSDKLSPEDLDTVCAMMKAKGAAEDEGETPMEKREEMLDKKAMDAAIKAAITANDAKHAAIADAQRVVRPYVGDLAVAFDSAEQVYRHTLDALGVPTKGLHKDALPAILAVQPKPGARPQQQARLAQDAAAAKGFSERFPSAARIGTM